MSVNKKFRLSNNSKLLDGREVFQIQALSDVVTDPTKGDLVFAGDFGGFIEKEDNLSYEANDFSWVYDDSVVMGDSRIQGNAVVAYDSIVKGNSVIDEASSVFVNGTVVDSKVTGNSHISNGEVLESSIHKSRVSGFIKGSNVYGDLRGAHVYNSVVIDSEVGSSDITHGSRVVGSKVFGSVVNDSKVNDSSLSKGAQLERSSVDYSLVTDHAQLFDSSASDHSVVDFTVIRDRSIVGQVYYKANEMKEIPQLSDLDLSELSSKEKDLGMDV